MRGGPNINLTSFLLCQDINVFSCLTKWGNSYPRIILVSPHLLKWMILISLVVHSTSHYLWFVLTLGLLNRVMKNVQMLWSGSVQRIHPVCQTSFCHLWKLNGASWTFCWYLNGRCLPPLLPSFEKPTETPVNLDYRSNAFHYPNNECIVESHAIKTSLKLIFNPLTDPSSQCNQAWCFSLTTSAHHIIHMTLSFCWGTLTTIYRFWHNLTDSKA